MSAFEKAKSELRAAPSRLNRPYDVHADFPPRDDDDAEMPSRLASLRHPLKYYTIDLMYADAIIHAILAFRR